MTINELKKEKERLGLTYEQLSQQSGVPLGTIQKIFGGFTRSPHTSTMAALERVLCGHESSCDSMQYAANRSSLPSGDTSGTVPSFKTSSGTLGDPRLNKLPAANHLSATYVPASSCTDASTDTTDVLREKRAVYNASRYSDHAGGALRYSMQGRYNAQDRNQLSGDIRTELIDGTIYDMSSPSLRHQLILMEIFSSLREYITNNNGECVPIISPFDVALDQDDRTIVQPDIMIICDRQKLHENEVWGAPDFIVEITSPSTGRKDRSLKLTKYKNAGVREYWIVDPVKKNVVCYWLDAMDHDPSAHDYITIYGFSNKIPVMIYDGKCEIDFNEINKKLQSLCKDQP